MNMEPLDKELDQGGDLLEGDKLIAVLSYITFLGFIIALILNAKKTGDERRFNAYHLRQGLGLVVLEIILYTGFSIIETVLLAISMSIFYFAVSGLKIAISIVVLIYMFIGVMNTLNGIRKPLPFIGKYAIKVLKNAFN